MNASDAAYFFGISKEKIQPGVYRLRCKMCGVTGREHVPKVGGNYTASEARKAIREHADHHVEKALEEHRERCLKEIEQRGKS